MTKTETQKAVWKPSWYEMDQSLTVGTPGKFWFFQDMPTMEWEFVDPIDLVFFNQLDSATNSEVRFARIDEIFHPVLGPLNRVDTDGLDYIFALANGTEIVVNAEEEPGQTYDDGLEIEDWSVLVTLTEISDPASEAV